MDAIKGNDFQYFGACMLYSLCSRNMWVNGNLINIIVPISAPKEYTAKLTVWPVRNSCQRQALVIRSSIGN